jgi:Ca2+-binding EF-hand superfamily protein
MNKYTEKELAEFREVFSSLDVDHKKRLNKKEFAKFLPLIGLDAGLVDLLFLAYDESYTGTLEFKEFLNFIREGEYAKRANDSSPYYRRVFKQLDRDKNGVLDANEFLVFAKVCKLNVNKNDIKAAMKKDNVTAFTFKHFPEICQSIYC